MPVYRTPVDGSGSHDDPYTIRHEDDHSADPSNYRQHWRGDWAYIASRYPIGTFEDLAEDEDSEVTKLTDDSDGTEEYPAPPEQDSEEDDPEEENDEDEEEDDAGE